MPRNDASTSTFVVEGSGDGEKNNKFSFPQNYSLF